MRKKAKYFAILLVVHTEIVSASMQSGYIIRLNNFCLRIQFSYDTPEPLETTERYLIDSSETLWGILTWVYNNKYVLRSVNTGITLSISYRSHEIRYPWTDLPNGISRNEINKAISSYGKYIGKDDLVANIGKILATILNIPYISHNNYAKIPMYIISSPDFFNIPAQFEESHVFFGPMDGEMKNYKRNLYYIFFWDLQSVQEYLYNYAISEYKFEQITLSKENIFDIFGIMY